LKGEIMLKNYLKIAARNILRHKGYSFINIAGIAMGIACCVVIIIFVNNELTYDSYHNDAERIYRIALHKISNIGESRSASTPGPLAPALKQNFPQVELAVRIIPPFENKSNVLVQRNNNVFYETRIWFAGPEIFQMFRIPFLQGDPATALNQPRTVILTEKMVKKYFGDENPIGKALKIELDYDYYCPVQNEDFLVTGIIENSPGNTHLKYDMFISMATMQSHLPWLNENWLDHHYKYSYVKLAHQTDVDEFEKQIQIMAHRSSKAISEKYNREYQLYEFFLQPVTDIHMKSNYYAEMETPGNWYYIYIYSIIAVLILLIGCMNFMNLSAAISTTRTKEVGLRKVVGAKWKQLVIQFLAESFIITICAFIVAFSLVEFFLPLFNSMANTELTTASLKLPFVLPALVGLLVLVGIGAGGYPAFILTKFKPVSILSGRLIPDSRGSHIQTVLIIGQFAISILLAVCTLTVFHQLNFMKGSALGFDREQKIVIPVKSNLAFLRTEYESIKSEFLQHWNITSATVSSGVPGQQSGGYYMTRQDVPDPEPQRFKVFTIDYDFISEFDIKILAGREFQQKPGNDIAGAFLINETGAKKLGFNNPIDALGLEMKAHYHGLTKTIVGITSDFHYHGMQEIVEPMLLDIENSLFKKITLTVNPDDLRSTITFIKEKWAELFPGIPFEYSFLDEIFDRQYRYEEQTGRLLAIITSIGLVIASLGLVGLASFTIQRRKKEIGIRKVLGATVSGIVLMLSKEFTKWVLFANIIAWPVAWYAMNQWLQNFAYRISIDWWVFLLAGSLALLIALLTVSIQAVKAAAANPVEALRYE
jgi:putative ABC transport system permease protein